jgi:hypothetical protein
MLIRNIEPGVDQLLDFDASAAGLGGAAAVVLAIAEEMLQ